MSSSQPLLYDVYDLRAAVPGINGSPSTSASDLAQAVTQVVGANAPDLHITVGPNGQQLILSGTAESIRAARALIERLDVDQQLVVLDTQVLEIDQTSASDLGISLATPLISTTFSEIVPAGAAAGSTARLLSPGALERTPLSLGFQLGLLIQRGNARVLADPRITTISGRTATIRAGDTIAIITTTGGGVGTVPTTQLQTFQTGVTLDITPIVNPSGSVTVALHPIVNSETGILNGIPQIATRDTQTTVSLLPDQTLVIGGLIQDTQTQTDTKVPVLGDLPLIGSFFHEKTKNRVRNELVITVTPHVVRPGELVPPVVQPPIAPTPPATQASPSAQATGIGPVATLPEGRRTPSARVTATPAIPTPSSSPSLDASLSGAFVYGRAPVSNVASQSDPLRFFAASLGPTRLRLGTPVRVEAVTTTNALSVTIETGGVSRALAQVAPGRWTGTISLDANALPVPPADVLLSLVARKLDGTSVALRIPVRLVP
ncbi:MAG: hypothetical protein NVSMB59_14780 [Vulcanimicrobiaceae bacterium]